MRKVLAGVLPCQNLSNATEKLLLRSRLKSVELLGIDKEAQRIAQEACLQIQIPQRSPLAVARTALRKVARKGGCPRNAFLKTSLPDEQHAAHQRFNRTSDLLPIPRRRGDLITGASEKVMNPRLMRHHQLSDEVAVGGEIALCVESSFQARYVRAGFEIQPPHISFRITNRLFVYGYRKIAPGTLGSVGTGHVPTAKPFLKRRAVAHGSRSCGGDGVPCPIGENRKSHKAGNIISHGGVVTKETREKLPLELRLLLFLLRQCVEDRAERGVHCGDFKNWTALNCADVKVVAEIDRAGSIGRYEKKLKARLGKHEALRRSRNLQLRQQSRKVAMLRIEGQPGLTGVNA